MPLFLFLSFRDTSISAVDGIWYHICATWENTAGSWKMKWLPLMAKDLIGVKG